MDDVGISSFRSSIRLASEARRSDGLKRRQNLSRVMKANETEFSEIFFVKSLGSTAQGGLPHKKDGDARRIS